MMSYAARHTSTLVTPQTEAVRGRKMVKNDGGGYSFPVDDWTMLERFLILGNEGGTYYVSEKTAVNDSVDAIDRCVALDPVRTVDTIVGISKAGRAPKNKHAVFALAYIAGRFAGTEAGNYALQNIAAVARYSTDFFQFMDDALNFRGRGGNGFKRAVGRWYTEKSPMAIARQVTKYPSRNGWSHRDVLRLAHPSADGLTQEVLQYVTQRAKWFDTDSVDHDGDVNQFLCAVEEAREADVKRLIELINDYGLEREHVPTEHLNNADVWAALLPNLKPWALLRNLNKLTAVGLMSPGSKHARYVRDTFEDPETIKQARLHPVTTLIGLRQYAKGQGGMGKLTWTPNQKIVESLEVAFYNGFDAVEPTGKTRLLCIDVSGSMSSNWGGTCAGGAITACEGAACMAMVVARTEPESYILGFAHEIKPLGITARDTLETAARKAQMNNFGGTDASLPCRYAKQQGWDAIDSFELFTDGESWGGPVHTFQALNAYRKWSGNPAKMVGFQMTARPHTLSDPNDAGMMDVIGFDTTAPAVVADFIRS